MKKFILLFLVTACATTTEGEYKKKYHLEDHKSSKKPAEMYSMLKEKMTKCYTQSDYPLYEKTIGKFNEQENRGKISYKIDNQSMGPKIMVFVEILPEGEGSLVKVSSHGDAFRAPGVYKHQIQKWIDGQKVDCGAHGDL